MPSLMRVRLMIGVLVGVSATAIPVGLSDAATPALTAAPPKLKTDQGCYLVGSSVALYGSGFAPGRAYDVAVDGVDFGQSKTDADGGFATHFSPGGLGAGVVQTVHHVDATDGTSDAAATFTVTRLAGARFVQAGDPRSLRARLQAWGFAMDGTPLALYLHYVSPSGKVRSTVGVGRVSGQCGYLQTRVIRMFPFTPSVGRWTVQVDTSQSYDAAPTGPVARVRVAIRRG
jgi:hypothetical protein